MNNYDNDNSQDQQPQLQAKKHFSQNFLVDANMRVKVVVGMKQIADSRDVKLVEIGPGQGDVTSEVLTWQKDFVAIEIDPDAVEFLNANLDTSQFELIHCDVMNLINSELPNFEPKTKHQNDTDFALPQDFNLISSLPYHIGSRLLVDLAVIRPQVNFGVIHQKEVILKTQTRSNFTFFGAWLNLFWQCDYLFDMPKHCFRPQPNVVSAFLQGYSCNRQNEKWLDSIQKREQVKQILKKLFSFPSKTLLNNLKALDWNTQSSLDFINKLNLESKTRLTWDNYQSILQEVVKEEYAKQKSFTQT
jgi:16S rRNA (adenine1518-N6/adenine1519-N6)-dimethyltransferase